MSVSVFAVALVAVSATVAMGALSNIASFSCPTSASVATGCYCTSGCSINGDTVFPWSTPVYPAALIPAATMGNDTICGKITIPTTTAGLALAAYLGISGAITVNRTYNGAVANSELTVWTAFTQAECGNFVTRVRAAAVLDSNINKLGISLCTTESCNTINVDNYPAAPATVAAAVQYTTLFPGQCPTSNPNATGCYCTNGCSINGDKTAFPWMRNSWAPVQYSSAFVGSDTICARIQVPIIDTVAGRNLSAYLGITGDIYRNGTSYFGAAVGQVVTVYTAFTQAECNNFLTVANAAGAFKTSVRLCTTEACNTINDPSSQVTTAAPPATTAKIGAAASSVVALVVAAAVAVLCVA